MNRPIRFTLSQIMIAVGVVAVLLWILTREPELGMSILVFAPPIACIAAVGCAVFIVSHLKLRYRLPIEIATLVALLGVSIATWWPSFYSSEERRCLNLAKAATDAWAPSRQIRRALDREASWLRRRATDLHWRGFWLGLTLGPKTRDHAAMESRSLAYELATLDSLDNHEKRVRQLINGVEPRRSEGSIRSRSDPLLVSRSKQAGSGHGDGRILIGAGAR